MNNQEAIKELAYIKIKLKEANVFINPSMDIAINIAIKALQGDMYCPSCGVRLVSENEYVEPKPYKGGDDE